MKNLTPTKIVSTLGPATFNEKMIKKLYKAGVTMFRINSSHDTIETHTRTLQIIRKVEKEENAIIPVLLDLQGPKIRIGELPEPIKVTAGEILKFRHQEKYTDARNIKVLQATLLQVKKSLLMMEKSNYLLKKQKKMSFIQKFLPPEKSNRAKV